MSVNLKKGGRLSLTKERPGLNRVIVGLGWDPVKKRGLFGFKEAKIDCDASAILCRNGKYSIKSDLIYFNSLHHKSGAVNHLGDNLTGEGDGDDERIIVDLKDLPSDVDRVIFTVNIFRGKQRGQSFDKIENAFIRVIDDRDDTELVHTDSVKANRKEREENIYYTEDAEFEDVSFNQEDMMEILDIPANSLMCATESGVHLAKKITESL